LFPVSAKNKIIVQKGVLDLRTWDWQKDGIVSLTGNWEFYWKKFYSPQFFKDTSLVYTKHYAFVPSLWNKYIPAGQNSDGGFGYATYHLVVLCPATKEQLALKFFTIESSYRLFVNNKEMLNVGHADTTAEATVAHLQPSIINVQPENNKLDIVIQVSNFNNSTGGIWYFNKLGTARQIHSDFIKNISTALFVAGSFFVAGIYYLILFLHFRNRYALFFFSILCFIFCTRTLVIEEMPALYISNLKWEFLRRAEYISLYLSVPIASLFSYHLFPQEFSRKILYIILCVCSIFVALSLFVPYYFYTFPLKYYEGIVFLSVFYGLYVYIRAVLKKRSGSFLFLAGFCIFLITIINDLLYENLIINTMWMFYIGLASFCITLSILVSRQFAQIFYDLQEANRKLSSANKELVVMNNEIMQQQSKMLQLRNRIQRDLHDDVGATLSSVKVYSEILKDNPDTRVIAELIKQNASEMIDRLEVISWATNPQHDTFGSFIDKLNRFAIPLFLSKNIQYNLDSNGISRDIIIPGGVRQNLYLVAKEAINNTIKYSRAGNCTINTRIKNGKFIMEITDDGNGFDGSVKGSGDGLKNMKSRVEELDGELTVTGTPAEGTQIKVRLIYPFKMARF
jgi:signal transduction histidine kinase